jgi:hypothetical protein
MNAVPERNSAWMRAVGYIGVAAWFALVGLLADWSSHKPRHPDFSTGNVHPIPMYDLTYVSGRDLLVLCGMLLVALACIAPTYGVWFLKRVRALLLDWRRIP